jgi:hypothetical protein
MMSSLEALCTRPFLQASMNSVFEISLSLSGSANLRFLMYGPAFWYDNELPPPTALAQMSWHVASSRTVVGPLDVLGLAVGGAPAAEGLEGSAAKA